MPIQIDLDKPQYDAFERARTASPYTLFDSKLIGDNRPMLWSDMEVSGSGTTSEYDSDNSCQVLSVSAGTNGKRVRQTYQRFNYQPGKSHQIMMTAVFGDTVDGVIKRVGYFDDDNGVFFEMADTQFFCVIRKNGVDRRINRNNWKVIYPNRSGVTGTRRNLESLTVYRDAMDGNGNSGIHADPMKAQIFTIDFSWLGVGSVRWGLFINGYFYYIHEEHHANTIENVYMRTPNLPVRYEIYADGNNAEAASLKAICSTVISEGGLEATGITHYVSTAGTHVDASVADTTYAILAIRLKSTHLDNIVRITDLSIINEQAGAFEWCLLLNPTIAGTFTYSDISNAAIQSATGATANTVTGGEHLAGGFAASGTRGGGLISALNNLRYLGSAVDGTPDEIVIAVTPLANNADIQAGIIYQENA